MTLPEGASEDLSSRFREGRSSASRRLRDHDALCPLWASDGHCQLSAHFMNVTCAKSCASITDKSNHTVQNSRQAQEQLEVLVDVQGHHRYTHYHHRLQLDPDNSDDEPLHNIADDTQCQKWAMTGQCQVNPAYMLEECALACSGPLERPFGITCPNVWNFIYDGRYCDAGYWCGCADPTGRLCIPTNSEGSLTAWVGYYTIDGEVMKGLAGKLGGAAFPDDFFRCNDTLYCPGKSRPFYCPQLCEAGYYCPNATVQIPCPEGHYCLMGQTDPTPCEGVQLCRFNQTSADGNVERAANNVPPEPGTVIYTSLAEFGLIMGCAAFCLLMLHVINHFLEDVEAMEDNEDNCQNYTSVRHLEVHKDGSVSSPKLRPGLGPKKQSSMVVSGPKERIDIAFQGLQLTLPNGLCIMEGVSGKLNHGQFCAIMGPSGAGKTTFLSLISGKNKPTGGKLLVNGEECSLTKYRRLVGYVPQEDIMLRELTVYENIKHAAMMRLPASMSKRKKIQRVEQVMQSLDLMHVKNTVVGDELKRGISGGQRKRVNVAMELVMDPLLICLDEPTSGLDSTSSAMLCESLVDLARLGVNVSAVLHQPKTEIFDMFDTVLLLGVGGQTVYLGPADRMVDYFTRIGFPLPPRTNPADYYMDVVAGMIPCAGKPGFKKEELFHLWESAPENPENGGTVMKPSLDDIVEEGSEEIEESNEIRQNSTNTTLQPTSSGNNVEMEMVEEEQVQEVGSPQDSPTASSGSSKSKKSDVVIEDPVPRPQSSRSSGSLVPKEYEELAQVPVKIVKSRVGAIKGYWIGLAHHIFDMGNPKARVIPGFFGQTWLLYRRAVLQRVRVPTNTFWPLLLSMFAGAITGGVASALGTTNQDSLQPIYYGISWPAEDTARASVYFLRNYPIPPSNNVVQLWQITVLVIMLVCILGINVFGRERTVFFRDAAGGMLVASYWLAKTCEVFLWLPLFSAVFAATSYAIQSLVMHMIDYFLIVWMSVIGFYGIGGCMSILVGLENRGIVTLVTGLIIILLFTGFLFPYAGAWYFRPFFTFWVAQAFNDRMYDYYSEAFDVETLNTNGAGYNLETSFGFNIAMAFVTGFAWHVLSLILLKCVDYRKQV